MLTVLIVIGTRPEAIKMAPIIKEMLARPKEFSVKICLTAQHREMLDQVTKLFEIEADFDLNVMREGQDLNGLTQLLLQLLATVVSQVDPDVVLVQGDTTTAFVAGLTGFYAKIPVGHIEAGLRTYDKYAPFPEEINRKMLSALAEFHFAPTPNARKALLSEGVCQNDILVTGNTVIDALHLVLEKIDAGTVDVGTTKRIIEENGKIVLVTGHRRENFGEGFANICSAIARLSDKYRDHCFVYPVHLNPNIQQPVRKMLGDRENVLLIDPLEYAPFVCMMDAARVILTDSGGVQEEAPSLGKPVLVMRHVTERPEAVEAGTAKLVGTDPDKIVAEVSTLLDEQERPLNGRRLPNPYGDGKAAQRIADFLSERLGA